MWTQEILEHCILLLKSGKNFKEISIIIGKTHESVSKKLRRTGHYYLDVNPIKYSNYKWSVIQKDYIENKLTYRDIKEKYKLTPQSIQWAIKNNLLKLNSLKESLKISKFKGRGIKSSQTGYKRYKQLCEFNFDLKKFSKEFDFNLIKEFGWYKASNRGNNINGVSRDHMISIKFGYENNISHEIISHPANCKLLRHLDNQTKFVKNSITLPELLEKIKNWNLKYDKVAESG